MLKMSSINDNYVFQEKLCYGVMVLYTKHYLMVHNIIKNYLNRNTI